MSKERDGRSFTAWRPRIATGGRPGDHILSPTEALYSRIPLVRCAGGWRDFKNPFASPDDAVISHQPSEQLSHRGVKLHLYVRRNIGFTLISIKTVLGSLRTVVSPVVAFQDSSNQMNLNAARECMPSILTPVSKIAPN